MWRLFQTAVVATVLSGNIYWHWTPNGYLASLIAGMAAFAATYSLSWLIDLFRRRGDSRPVITAEGRRYERRNPWVGR